MIGRGDPASPTGGWITDPVIVDSGEFVFRARDAVWRHDGTAVAAVRLYRHQTANQAGLTDFGRNFHTNLRIVVDESADKLTATVNLGSGEDLPFTRPDTSTDFATLAGWERYDLDKIGNTQYILTDRNGYQYSFLASTTSSPVNLISTRNRFDEGEDYYYDGSSRLNKITVSSGRDINVDRDAAGLITKIHDYAGRTVNYAYDGASNLTKAEDACGTCSTIPTAEYAYDINKRITTVKDADGTTVRTIAYDGSDRVDYYDDALGNRWDFDHDGSDSSIDPEGNIVKYTFNGDGRVEHKTISMTGADIEYIYQYDSNHHVTHATMPNDATVDYTYDSRGNLISQLVSADSTTITAVVGSFDSGNGVALTKNSKAS